jgi:hypothetical protein
MTDVNPTFTGVAPFGCPRGAHVVCVKSTIGSTTANATIISFGTE